MILLVGIWVGLNQNGLAANWHDLTTNDDIEEQWIPDAVHFHRIDQALSSVLTLLLEFRQSYASPEAGVANRYAVKPRNEP